MDLEAQTLANLAEKERLLAELNLNNGTVGVKVKATTTKRDKDSPLKKRKVVVPQAPTRTSARLKEAPAKPNYNDLDNVRLIPKSSTRKSRPARVVRARSVSSIESDEELEEKPDPSADIEIMRENWSNWRVEGAQPTRDEYGAFHFDDFPDFNPNKSPEEMIREGCFGGSYWRPLKSRHLGIVIRDDWQELPPEWIQGLNVERFLTSPTYDPEVNKYKVACGQSIEEWEASGWIMHEYDVRGWFQWYCRFYQGRRCPDDGRQVSRWRKCVGPTGRWKRMLLKKFLTQGVRECFDVSRASHLCILLMLQGW